MTRVTIAGIRFRASNHATYAESVSSQTTLRSFTWTARRQRWGRRAGFQARSSASWARYSGPPPWRVTSRLAVDAARSRPLAVSRIDEPEALTLTHEAIGQMIGASREIVKRTFADFNRKQLLQISGSALIVCDQAELLPLAGT
jgi:CRP-like cAMP-binding protein